MTIHYHGTPITPRSTLLTLAGRHFCVSFAQDQDLKIVHEIGQSVMLDNGAFTAWTQGIEIDWYQYYAWVEPWLNFRTTWAVIPDMVDGSEKENDYLVDAWPFGNRGSPVWHLHEPLERLFRLCTKFNRVCLGSSGEYTTVGNNKWHQRMIEVFNTTGNSVWFHGLRMMDMGGSAYPFASLDSANVARNHNKNNRTARQMVAEIDTRQCPGVWHGDVEQGVLL